MTTQTSQATCGSSRTHLVPADRIGRAPRRVRSGRKCSELRAELVQSGRKCSELRAELATLRPELYARAMRMCCSPPLAEDIVQDTMVRALRFEAQYRPGTNLRAWVGQILRSVFLTRCRRKRRERKALDHLRQDPCAWTKRDAPSVVSFITPAMGRALESLNDGYRRAVQLVDLEGLTYREAATRLGIPVGTVMSRLHRGRRLLAAHLAETAQPAGVPALAAA